MDFGEEEQILCGEDRGASSLIAVLSDRLPSSRLVLGGAVRWRQARAAMAASVAPAAPSMWPTVPFDDDTSRGFSCRGSRSLSLLKNACLIASSSDTSPRGVDVAWAFT